VLIVRSLYRRYSGIVTCSCCKKKNVCKSKDAAIGEKVHRIDYDEGQKRWRTTWEEGKSESEGEGLLNSWHNECGRERDEGGSFKGAEREREREMDRTDEKDESRRRSH